VVASFLWCGCVRGAASNGDAGCILGAELGLCYECACAAASPLRSSGCAGAAASRLRGSGYASAAASEWSIFRVGG